MVVPPHPQQEARQCYWVHIHVATKLDTTFQAFPRARLKHTAEFLSHLSGSRFLIHLQDFLSGSGADQVDYRSGQA